MPTPTGANPALGAYYTRGEVAGAIVDRIVERAPDALDKKVLEPSVGGGAFLDAILARAPAGAQVFAVDVNAAAAGLRHPDPRVRPIVGDFLTLGLGPRATVIGNPPFSIQVPSAAKTGARLANGAQKMVKRSVVAEHIRAALAASSRHVFLLFRLGVLASGERGGLTTGAGKLREVWPLRPRPAFHGAKTSDNSEYAVFWWDQMVPATWAPRISHLRWRDDLSPGRPAQDEEEDDAA